MKLAFSANAFRKHSALEAIETIAAIGYDRIDIIADVPHAEPPDLHEDDKREITTDRGAGNLEISHGNAFLLCTIQDFQHTSWHEQ